MMRAGKSWVILELEVVSTKNPVKLDLTFSSALPNLVWWLSDETSSSVTVPFKSDHFGANKSAAAMDFLYQ